MGLDIHAASQLRYLRPLPEGDERERLEEELYERGQGLGDAFFTVYPNDEGYEARLGGTEPGLYEYTPASEQYEFRAGSYSGYNLWRELLSRFALGAEPEDVWSDPEAFAGRPFVELIHFTDCDGCIGTAVSAKLAADFTSHAAAAGEYAAGLADQNERSYFAENYDEFARAFGLAAQNGALKFC